MAVLLSPGALAAVPTDTVVTATTLTASKRIYMLAADESHVAVAYESQRNCIESWDVVARKLVRFSEGSCESAPTSEDTAVFGLAVAGSRLAWAGGMFTLHDWEWVATATRTRLGRSPYSAWRTRASCTARTETAISLSSAIRRTGKDWRVAPSTASQSSRAR